jgi:hypothetical protein
MGAAEQLALAIRVQPLRAPQYGVWGELPPRTDNPAARTHAPMPAAARELLARLRSNPSR